MNICFDLEGPLTPQDNAYELMKRSYRGGDVFEVISRYDDLLSLEGRPDYEPGDTLALIVPFLVCSNITEQDLTFMAERAPLTPGASELISRLQFNRWNIYCISTSYDLYALKITKRLGIPAEQVSCTCLPLDKFHKTGKADCELIARTRDSILELGPTPDDARIKTILNAFYLESLPRTSLGILAGEVRPVGGQRKVEALKAFAEKDGTPLSNWVVVGDSITDFKMLQAVDDAGGLAIAFNANEYSLPHATIGVASTRLSDLWEVLEVWQRGRRPAVLSWVTARRGTKSDSDRRNYHWVSGITQLDPILKIHKRIRALAREDASRLG